MRTTFEVKGMKCEGCEERVRTALQRFSGITTMEVDHHRDLVAIEHQGLAIEEVAAAIARLGYAVSKN